VEGGSRPGYRIVGYRDPEGTTLWSVTLPFQGQRLHHLQTAIPDFDPQLLNEDHKARIVFAHEMELTNAQLSVLGLL